MPSHDSLLAHIYDTHDKLMISNGPIYNKIVMKTPIYWHMAIFGP